MSDVGGAKGASSEPEEPTVNIMGVAVPASGRGFPLAPASEGPSFSRLDKVREWAERGVRLAYLSESEGDEEYIRARCSAEVLAILDGHDD